MQISEEQKKEDIREAQIYLRVVAEANPAIPIVIPNGVYDNETAEAIKAFQREYGLAPTGKIDAETWNALYRAYLEAAVSFMPLQAITPLTQNNAPLTEGDAGYLIYILQAMINTVTQFYDNTEGVTINGIYDNETAEAVRLMQGIIGKEQTGITDTATWNGLARLYNFHAGIDDKDTLGKNEPMTIPASLSASNVKSVG